MREFAPRFTQGNMGATVTVAASGASIDVYGVVVANTGSTDRTVVFTTTDSPTSDVLFVRAEAEATVVVEIPFLADRGLDVALDTSTDNNVQVTVFHSNVGA